jgi:predicted AlkP superfamily phosphohydrolase/phosphomutase
MNAIDWSRTQAFASPVQGVRLNLKGRERLGSVEPADAPALARAITERFMQLRADDGSEITDRVWSAADAYHGDWQEGASDLLPVLRGHRWDLDVELFHRDPFSNHTGLPRGVHHIDGIVSLSGPGAAPSASLDNARVEDIAPTLMHLGGLSVPEGLDGRALTEGLLPAWTRSHPVREAPAVEASGSSEASPYSAEEETQIEEALRGLGYL